jgi:hypothetical protein
MILWPETCVERAAARRFWVFKARGDHHAREIRRLDDKGRHRSSGWERRIVDADDTGVGSGSSGFRHDAGHIPIAENILG